MAEEVRAGGPWRACGPRTTPGHFAHQFEAWSVDGEAGRARAVEAYTASIDAAVAFIDEGKAHAVGEVGRLTGRSARTFGTSRTSCWRGPCVEPAARALRFSCTSKVSKPPPILNSLTWPTGKVVLVIASFVTTLLQTSAHRPRMVSSPAFCAERGPAGAVGDDGRCPSRVHARDGPHGRPGSSGAVLGPRRFQSGPDNSAKPVWTTRCSIAHTWTFLSACWALHQGLILCSTGRHLHGGVASPATNEPPLTSCVDRWVAAGFPAARSGPERPGPNRHRRPNRL